ncbi:MAG: TM0106 family RecB-like putative nuclease, partial [Bacteroidetes bacterium]|nr:TM0106 family RecB-like putative nuclease [Bacteroidota bacterium]
PDDIFLDLEGDPMVPTTGREYIIGWFYKKKYFIEWAENDDDEKMAFEKFIKLAFKLFKSKPGMHIYHFGAYETSAFKRLMCKYATQVNEMDTLLRAGAFVDLHGIVKYTLRAGVEKYSLKDLEKYHGYLREADLRSVAPIKAEYEYLLETNRVAEATKAMKKVIAKYNEDDCISTAYLFNWLCAIRTELRQKGEIIPPPEPKSGDPSQQQTDHQLRVKPIFDALLKDIPATKEERTKEQQLKYLVAHMLDWYGRELKKTYWELFRMMELSEDDLLEESAALASLQFTGQREFLNTTTVDTYTFTQQFTDIKKDDKVLFHLTDGEAIVQSIDKSKNTIELKKSAKYSDLQPVA